MPLRETAMRFQSGRERQCGHPNRLKGRFAIGFFANVARQSGGEDADDEDCAAR